MTTAAAHVKLKAWERKTTTTEGTQGDNNFFWSATSRRSKHCWRIVPLRTEREMWEVFAVRFFVNTFGIHLC